MRLSVFNSPRVKFTPQDAFGVHVNKAPEIFAFLKANIEDLISKASLLLE